METADQENCDQLLARPIMAIDLGEKRVGVAVSDALSISITRARGASSYQLETNASKRGRIWYVALTLKQW